MTSRQFCSEQVSLYQYAYIQSLCTSLSSFVATDIYLLSAVNKQPLAMSRLKMLLPSLASTSTKDELSPELPLKRNVPLLSGALVDDGVVVLKVGAQAFGLERDPEVVLVHGVGVLGPVAE
ncbi:hypothetical protein IAQ61_004794 [Plenodomus lingam]|uniref:uncharacterized protein n=1 Tax=Leptosphaeria maculans TaxID=5022 RepID=UPI003329BDB7|nr:hypothetical protein IAQ61_004794 [Plenodomus lingam]